ncbi:GyrI-like domain-containing protein [Clostridium botulinum]|uniref:GyrI-like domain-containing protein n=1 Tax=Clostridium botulinum TaxID=1491 RepID=UPI0021C1DD56|nr:GyrI-like domain-containing protein [Clostridium botulinum]
MNNITIQPVIKVIPEVKVIGIKGKTSLKNNLLPDLWNAFNKSSSKIINKVKPLKYYGISENDRPNNQFGENVSYSEIVGIEVTSFDYIYSYKIEHGILDKIFCSKLHFLHYYFCIRYLFKIG